MIFLSALKQQRHKKELKRTILSIHLAVWGLVRVAAGWAGCTRHPSPLQHFPLPPEGPPASSRPALVPPPASSLQREAYKSIQIILPSLPKAHGHRWGLGRRSTSQLNSLHLRCCRCCTTPTVCHTSTETLQFPSVPTGHLQFSLTLRGADHIVSKNQSCNLDFSRPGQVCWSCVWMSQTQSEAKDNAGGVHDTAGMCLTKRTSGSIISTNTWAVLL